MTRPVRAPGAKADRPGGEDKQEGPLPSSHDKEGSGPQSVPDLGPWSSNGRTPALTSRKSGSETRPGNQVQRSGASAALTAKAPDQKPGIAPELVTANLNIAR